MPKTTLDQWRSLIAVVDEGGYAQAAEALHKSQSAVTYAIQKLEQQLGVALFEVRGRKAELTAAGHTLYRRARALLGDTEALEQTAGSLAAGWEAQLRLAVDVLFPTWLMLDCLAQFFEHCPHTRVELLESVLSGAEEALLEGRADIAITGRVPPGFLGEALMRVRFVAVAHPGHPLHQLGRELTPQDLRQHRQLVVRDSARRTERDSGWLEAAQRLTVSHATTSIAAICRGLGFAWLPVEKIRSELANGQLKALPLREGGERFAELYLVYADPDGAGPAARKLVELLREGVAQRCADCAETAANPENPHKTG